MPYEAGWLQGIIQTLIGGVLGYGGARLQDFFRTRSERKQRLYNLLAEMKDNEDLVIKHQLADGAAKIRLQSSMWDIAKGDIVCLRGEVQELLRQSYAEIYRFNSIVDYDIQISGTGRGTFNQALEQAKNKVNEHLKPAIDSLSNHLGQPSR